MLIDEIRMRKGATTTALRLCEKVAQKDWVKDL